MPDAGGTDDYRADRGFVQDQPPQAVRRRATRVGGPGPGHRNVPGRRGRGQLFGQPGLADPRLARAQHQPPAPSQGIIEQTRDARQLTVAAHQGRVTPHGATIRARAIPA